MQPKLYDFTPEIFCRFFLDHLCTSRKSNNISQEIVANNLGITQQRISHFEMNAVQPNIYFIFKYIYGTGLKHADIFSILDRIVIVEQKFFYLSEPTAIQN